MKTSDRWVTLPEDPCLALEQRPRITLPRRRPLLHVEPEIPRWVDLRGLPAPPWEEIHKAFARAYGYCVPTGGTWTDDTRPLRSFPRWRFEPHAHKSLAKYTDGRHLFACGIQWMRLEETDQERADLPSLFLTNRPTSEVRPLWDRHGHECLPESLVQDGLLWWRCPGCGYRIPTISGGAGNTYWISASGSNSNSGTAEGSPKRTWSAVVALAGAGDIIMVADGNYVEGDHGLLRVNQANGTSGARIVITAKNERAPVLSCPSGTQNTVEISRNFVDLVGLCVENADNQPSADWLGYCILGNADDYRIQRCLVRRSNRWHNVHPIGLYGQRPVCFETEIVEHNRYIDGIGSETAWIQRCFVNQRGVAVLHASAGPTQGWYFYNGNDSIGENNIVENIVNSGYGCQGQYRTGFRGRYLGNICRSTGGFGMEIMSNQGILSGEARASYTQDTLAENGFNLDCSASFRLADAERTTVRHFTQNGQIVANDTAGVGADGSECSCELYGMSVVNRNIQITGQGGGAAVRYSNIFNGNYAVQGGTTLQNNTLLNPGTLRPWTPDASPLRNAAEPGTFWPSQAPAANKGCDILFAYDHGVLTSTTLWDKTTGAWRLKGAIKAGWNDVAGSSLFDVHNRLNVDPLLLPPGYGGVGPVSVPGQNTIWDTTSAPGVFVGADSMIECGVRFRVIRSGRIVALLFYKHTNNTGPHVGNLYTLGGSLIASQPYISESTSGWQRVLLDSPPVITAGTTYVASYTTTTGFYAYDGNYFTSSFSGQVVTALANGVDGPNGCHKYGGGFPSDTPGTPAANFWVDVEFETVDPGARGFDGATQALQSETTLDLSALNKITVSAWVRID